MKWFLRKVDLLHDYDAKNTIFRLTLISNNLIYESHCDVCDRKSDVRENQSMKYAAKKAAAKKPTKKPATKKKK
jgi:hypothetical protein